MKNDKFLLELDVVAFILIFSLLMASLFVPIPLEVDASGSTIYVPDDYTTIQAAIDNATVGDTIIVRDGNTYEESITVGKRLTIQGEDKETTIIDAMGDSDAVYIYADDVRFSGFTVHNCTDDGIHISSNNVTITDCIISGCDDDGIYLSHSDNSTIEACEVHDCHDGIYLYRSINTTIKNSEVYNIDYYNIWLRYSQDCLISDSEVHHNNYYGLYLIQSMNITINGCKIFNNTGHKALYLESSDDAKIFDCDVYNNSVWNAIDIYYSDKGLVQASRVYDNSGRGAYIQGCDEVTVKECYLYNNDGEGISVRESDLIILDSCQVYDHKDDYGIEIFASDLCWIKNCTSYNNSNGVYVSNSDIVSICKSHFHNNTANGIDSYGSLKLYIMETVSTNNAYDGLEMDYSQGVSVNCNFSENQYGINARKSTFNSQYCSFENNTDNGVSADYLSNVDASNCWWGNATGPYHSTENPTGTGDQVSNNVIFEPWQTTLTQPGDLISNLRCNINELNWRVVYPDDETPKPLGCIAAMVSDWLASAFVTTKLSSYVEGVDTNGTFVNQTTGKPLGDPGIGILTFGGSKVNPIVKRAEDDFTSIADRAPVKFHSEGGIFYFQYANGTNIPGANLPLSVINEDEDMFVVETYTDGDDRLMVVCYGFGWQGTYAAGKFFEEMIYPHLALFTDGWVIVHWEDTNGDGFVNNPCEGDSYTLIASGN